MELAFEKERITDIHDVAVTRMKRSFGKTKETSKLSYEKIRRKSKNISILNVLTHDQ